MRIRTMIAKLVVGRDMELRECPVCGKLGNRATDLAWHTKECMFISAVRHGTPLPSFQKS